jgi:hypothetical protein
LFWSFSYLVCRGLLQVVLLRRRSEAFKELEIVWVPETGFGMIADRSGSRVVRASYEPFGRE